MVLYHGTAASRAQKIITDGVLSNRAERNYDENANFVTSNSFGVKLLSFATTPGYVYLTDYIIMAVYYGNKHAIYNKEDYFYVFVVDIDENKLLPDMDEVGIFAETYCLSHDEESKYKTAKDTLERMHSARYDNNIEKFMYCKLPVSSNFGDTNCELVKEIAEAYVQGINDKRAIWLNYIEQLKEKLEKICDWK